MAISRQEVLRIAQLARIELTDVEVDQYRQDLGSILGYADKLAELDLAGVEPTTHAVELESRLRDDRVGQTLTRDEVLGNAADTEAGHFRVPKAVEGNS